MIVVFFPVFLNLTYQGEYDHKMINYVQVQSALVELRYISL